MNLSKSKYCLGVTCKKKLWLETNKPEVKEEENGQVLLNGTLVGEYARKLLGKSVTIPFNKDLNEMINDTKKYLKEDNIVICEASFNYNHNFCSVDLLKKEKNSYIIYEVKSSTSIHDIYLDDISYQYYILKNLGYNVIKTCLVLLNPFYIKHGEIDIKKLFKIEDVTDTVLEKVKEIDKNIQDINLYMENKEELKSELSKNCKDCPYFSYCTKDLDSNNVFKVRDMQMRKMLDLYNNGITSFPDLLKEPLNPKFKQQIEFTLYDKEPYIDEYKLKEFLETLHYPLYFLDFETYQVAIPNYDGVKPYMQIPFQYSLHYIESEDGELKHKEFLGEVGVDPRYSLAKSLAFDIPLDSCVMAYNMRFEKMVIRELASLYPDLSDKLLIIHDNIVDLMVPFKNRNYYTKEMSGSYSIKAVLPALFPDDPSLNYHNLEDVHNGSEASSSFVELEKLSQEEQEKIRNSLLKYCSLDTYAMVKIWEKLKEVTKEKVKIRN